MQAGRLGDENVDSDAVKAEVNGSRTNVVNGGRPIVSKARSLRQRRRVVAPPPSRYGVLVLVVLIAAVCSTLVGLGRVRVAAAVMWGLLGLMAAWFISRGRLDSLACLLIGVAPVVNLLRGALFYSGVPLVFAAVVAWWVVTDSRKVADAMRRCPLAFLFLGMAAVYYACSFAMTGEFRSNLRVFELAGAAVLVVMLHDQPRLLKQALLGATLSALLIGLGEYPHLQDFRDMRLGMVQAGDYEVGNPFALGMPLALGVLAIVVDKGHWIGLAHKPVLRFALLLPTVGLLALSTSRAAWLVAAGGMVVAFCTVGRQRFLILLWIAIVSIAGLVFWQTPIATPFHKGWERTFGEGRTLNESSSGRLDQWVIFGHALTESPARFLSGYGPGNGPEVQAVYSSRLLGLEMRMGVGRQFHALLMQVGIDFGFLGLAPLLAWLVIVAWRCYQGCRASGLYLPLACFVGFVLASSTASGFDTVSGTFLGMALLATFPSVPANRRLALGRSPRQRWCQSAGGFGYE